MDITVLNNISYGMYILGTKYKGRNVGCFVNTIVQITSENPTLAISINKNNYTNEALREVKKFSISILSENTDSKLIGKFGFFSSRNTEKFSEINYEEVEEIPLIKENMCGNVICEVLNVVEVGTHDIFIVKILDTFKNENKLTPMTYRYYHEVIKGKAPKTAPTYIEEENENKVDGAKKYRCKICGHIYDENIEKIKFIDLPETWTCPVCGVGKEYFEEI